MKLPDALLELNNLTLLTLRINKLEDIPQVNRTAKKISIFVKKAHGFFFLRCTEHGYLSTLFCYIVGGA